MIYLFAGDDAKKKVATLEGFLGSFDTEILKINRKEFDSVYLENLYASSGLFSTSFVVLLNNLLEHEESRDFLLDRLEELSSSKSKFIFLEGKLNKATLDMFRLSRAELNLFELPKEKLEKFDNFLLANALGVRDKLNLWIYFRQATDLGVSPEELVGVLFWKVKDMLLKKNFSKFSKIELENLSKELAVLLPRARVGGTDVVASFERFLLNSV